MRKIILLQCLLLAASASAQMPTNFGTNAEDGISYQNYNLTDHSVVSSVRFMAQNSIPAGVATWEFYTGDYSDNWRPYAPDDTLSSYNAMIDPASENASARYNSNYGGSPGRMPAVQAGYYYTCIVGDNALQDNFMSIVETDFEPVVIDTVFITPTNPTENDPILFTVVLNGSNGLSPGEHVFVRFTTDGWATTSFLEVSNFSNGVGTTSMPALPAATTVYYYALVTPEAVPQHETIDYFTLFFGNNSGLNYSFDVSAVTGIEEVRPRPRIEQNAHGISVINGQDIEEIRLYSLDGKLMLDRRTNGLETVELSTDNLPEGVFMLQLDGDAPESYKVLISH